MEYKRFFITLSQDRAGFAAGAKAPTGRATLEVRNGAGRITTYVQGLKPLDKGSYMVYLISSKNSENMGVAAGLVKLDEKGKFEGRWDFNPTNIGGSGLTLEDINVVAILVKSDDSEIISPLVGYRAEKLIWKNNFSEAIKQTPGAVEATEIEEVQVVEIAEPEIEEAQVVEVVEEATEIQAVESSESVEIEVSIEIEETTEQISSAAEPQVAVEAADEGEKPEENKEDIVREAEPETEPETDEKQRSGDMDEETECLKNIDMNFELEKNCVASEAAEQVKPLYMFEKNPKLNPFASNLQDVDWVRMSLEEVVVLPVDARAYINNSFVVANYKRFRHLILGARSEGGHILGVPAEYRAEDAIVAQALGFEQFKGCEDREADSGDYGYWLMFI